MNSSNTQLIIIADTLPQHLRNRSLTFSKKLNNYIKESSLIYTTLLPGPELEIAKLAYIKKIPYIVLIPYRHISKRWPQFLKDQYGFYIKKSIRRIYIDREINYISEIKNPDHFHSSKIEKYLQWIIDVPVKSAWNTKLVYFTRGFQSKKMNNFYRLTNYHSIDSNEDKFKIIQTTFMECHEEQYPKDILPF